MQEVISSLIKFEHQEYAGRRDQRGHYKRKQEYLANGYEEEERDEDSCGFSSLSDEEIDGISDRNRDIQRETQIWVGNQSAFWSWFTNCENVIADGLTPFYTNNFDLNFSLKNSDPLLIFLLHFCFIS